MPPRKRTNLEAWQLCYKVTGSDEPGHSLGSTNMSSLKMLHHCLLMVS